tara:strand:- start:82 stop:975 length:894 start_codon:yes stop_codon:yes gene_type:complete
MLDNVMKHALNELMKDLPHRKYEPYVETLGWINVAIILGICIGILGWSFANAGDNHVHVDQVQSGDNFELDVDQIGHNNLVDFSFNHQNNIVNLLQSGNNNYIGYTDLWGSGYNWGGDLDGLDNEVDIRQKCSASSCNDNDFQFHIWGDNNEVAFGQGYENNNSLSPNWNYDGTEPGGNFVRLDIHGDNNKFKGSQKMDTSSIRHDIIAYIYGDDNDVYVRQMQNGNKDLDLRIYNDDNEVTITQKNNGAHNATITITGTYATDLSLSQVGNTTQNYTLSQNCITSGGCSVTVTQGN